MRSSSFRSSPSLHRLRTALSPTRSQRGRHHDEEASTPLSRASSGRSPSSSVSSVSSIRQLLLLRRKPSCIEVDMEEERRSFGAELEMLEPRPVAAMNSPIFEVCEVAALPVPGIFEVLDGDRA